jgi:hypothetical protein
MLFLLPPPSNLKLTKTSPCHIAKQLADFHFTGDQRILGGLRQHVVFIEEMSIRLQRESDQWRETRRLSLSRKSHFYEQLVAITVNKYQ